MRVLVAEDDAALRSVLERGLRENGYVVDAVVDGESALSHLRAYDYEVAILDWRMPKISGLDVVERARRRGDRTPVLMLTARDTTSDRIAGLNSGADDYLVKPFEFGELLARVKAVLRRRTPDLNRVVVVGDLSIDTATREVRVGDRPLELSVREYDLLHFLAVHADEVLHRQRILDEVWGYNFFGDENNVEVYIRYLRQKLGDTDHQRIQTVRGVGYRLHAVSGVAPA